MASAAESMLQVHRLVRFVGHPSSPTVRLHQGSRYSTICAPMTIWSCVHRVWWFKNVAGTSKLRSLWDLVVILVEGQNAEVYGAIRCYCVNEYIVVEGGGSEWVFGAAQQGAGINSLHHENLHTWCFHPPPCTLIPTSPPTTHYQISV